MELFNESVQRIKSNLSLYDEMIAYKHSRIYRKQWQYHLQPYSASANEFYQFSTFRSCLLNHKNQLCKTDNSRSQTHFTAFKV